MAKLKLEEPIVIGRATLRMLVREDVTAGLTSRGLWAVGQKMPLAVRVEIDGDTRDFALEPLTEEARACLGLGVDPAA